MGNQTSCEWEAFFKARRHVFIKSEQQMNSGTEPRNAQNKHEINLGRKLNFFVQRLIDILPQANFADAICNDVNKYRISESEDRTFHVISGINQNWNSKP